MLDEPWEGLDRRAAALLAARLDECAAEGTHIVTASHLDIDELRHTHEMTLDAGRIVRIEAREAALSRGDDARGALRDS